MSMKLNQEQTNFLLSLLHDEWQNADEEDLADLELIEATVRASIAEAHGLPSDSGSLCILNITPSKET